MSGGESSKIVVRRTAKQIKAALVIAIECRNLGVRICDERMNNKEKQPRASKRKHKERAIALVKPDNVKSKEDWDKFVKERLGAEFQKLSEKFRAMRKQQKYTHTMSRKGYARMEYDMKLNHSNPEEINRVTLWTKAHERKDGTPINEVVSNILRHNKNVEDMISAHACTQVLRLCLTILPNYNPHHFDKDFEVQLTKFLKHVSA
ncbi:hypothetical protein ACE6H2_010509 [Prunus campanulata]